MHDMKEGWSVRGLPARRGDHVGTTGATRGSRPNRVSTQGKLKRLRMLRLEHC